jgi:hypothetical protein
MRRSLDDDYTLEGDLAAVVAHCEATGQKIENRPTGRFPGTFESATALTGQV